MDDQHQTPNRRHIRFKGRPLKRHPADKPEDMKTREEREIEALENDPDAPPPLEAHGMRQGCSGCLWVTMLFFALLLAGVLLNCVRF